MRVSGQMIRADWMVYDTTLRKVLTRHRVRRLMGESGRVVCDNLKAC